MGPNLHGSKSNVIKFKKMFLSILQTIRIVSKQCDNDIIARASISKKWTELGLLSDGTPQPYKI